MDKSKEEIIAKLRKYKTDTDDDNIRYKQLIKEKLVKCDELIYCFDNKVLIGSDADNDEYFGVNIIPHLLIPKTQDTPECYICYKVEFEETPQYNKFHKYGQITFIVLCDQKIVNEKVTGISRHDLIASIIREQFNYTNLFGNQLVMVSNKESTTDTNYATRTLVFEITTPNNITVGNKVVNNIVRK